MAAQVAQPSSVEATYKVREAEGILDLYFYRKVGFRLAQFFAKLGISPISVSLLGGVFGLVAGHLYYYRDLRFTFAGMALHVVANAFDNADGQLARMTGKASQEGRIIDGLVDHLIFANIYIHLGFRSLGQGNPLVIWILIGAAALSHSVQAGAADYFRNAFHYFVYGRGELDSSANLKADGRALDWRRQPWKKLMLALCLSFARQQEILVPKVNRLRSTVDRLYGEETPGWFKARYSRDAAPLFRWCGFLMTNTRMILLFFFLLIDRPLWFCWVELTAFNVVLIWLVARQTRMSASLLQMTMASPNPAH